MRKMSKKISQQEHQSAQEKKKEYFDRKHSLEIFEEGAEVLMEIRSQKQRKGGKLDDKFFGPYMVNRHMVKGLDELISQGKFCRRLI